MPYQVMNYFQPKETRCKCGCGLDITAEMLVRLNDIRAVWGKPLVITSGARCVKHNATIGGAKASKHISGTAVDFAATPEFKKWISDRLDLLNVWIEDPAFTPTWVHVQILPPPGTPRIFKP